MKHQYYFCLQCYRRVYEVEEVLCETCQREAEEKDDNS